MNNQHNGKVSSWIWSVLVSLAVGGLVTIVFEMAWPERSIYKIWASVIIGFLALGAAKGSFYLRELLLARGRRLEDTLTNFNASLKVASPVLNGIHQILSQTYSKELTQRIAEQAHQSQHDLQDKVNQLFTEWADRIARFPKWRLVFEHHLSSRIRGTTYQSITTSLQSYLDTLYDLIEVGIAEAVAMDTKLIVSSFTNATPADWGASHGSASSDVMSEFLSRLKRLVEDPMRDNDHIYNRYVLCSSTLSGFGFSDVGTVEEGWKNLSAADKKGYFSVHSSGEENAFYVKLYPEIKFYENYTAYFPQVEDLNRAIFLAWFQFDFGGVDCLLLPGFF